MIARVLSAAILVIAGVQAIPATAQTLAASSPSILVQRAVADDPGHPPISLATWAPRKGSALPLIVISHGTAAAMTSHQDTASALAEAGFVVVAPLHTGDNFRDMSVVGRPQWFADRSRHVGRAIDFMLTKWEGRARLDPGRIGVFGFSAGGTTALIAVGGVPDMDRVANHCATAKEVACDLIAKASLPTPPQWTYDPRIKAAVVAAPGVGFAFVPSGLSQVSVPVQLWAAEKDQTVPYASNTGVVRGLLPKTTEFHSVEGAGHDSFLTPCAPGTVQSEICDDPAGFDRAAFHREFNRQVVRFFRSRLSAP